MLVIDDILLYGKASISLLPSILDVSRKVKRNSPNPSIHQLVDQIAIDTREECKNLAEELRSLRRDLNSMGLLEGKGLNEIYEETTWYLNPVYRHKLKRRKKALEAIEAKLSASVDDLMTVLLCKGHIGSLSKAKQDTEEIRKQLDSLESAPLAEVIDQQLTILDSWVQNLR
jgi:hypothetical protein